MKKVLLISFVILSVAAQMTHAQKQAVIKLTEKTLMHEMRATPYPLDKAVVNDRAVSFQWPLRSDMNSQDSPLDGFEHKVKKVDKTKITYRLRYSQDAGLKSGVVQVETRWPFYNPEQPLAPGVWYWQFGYVEDGQVTWGSTQQVTVEDRPGKFCPPSLKTVLAKLPTDHPRVWIMKNEWKDFINHSKQKAERQWYLERADQVLQTPMKSVKDINVSQVKNLKNEMQINSYLTRESRRIIDAEEGNTEALIRAWLLTQDTKYADEAIKRVFIMADWDKDKNVKGDFNASSLLSLCSMAYDSFYDRLNTSQKKALLEAIKNKGGEMYENFNNRMENHIADNHVWQMTLRILTMASFSVYGDLPEANTWVDYCYNVWLARFPGLNKDGGWHNGDSYFTVNTRTLVEVPYYYSKLTGYDFFSDPWYQGNIMYTIFQQPPFSKSAETEVLIRMWDVQTVSV